MRNVRTLALALAAMALVVTPSATKAQSFEIIAQIGFTLAEYSGDGISSGTEAALSAGGKVRFGSVIYVDGGVFWTRSGGQINSADGSGELTLSSIRFPVTLGWRIIRASILDLRVFGGVAFNSVSSIDTTDGLTITDDDVKGSNTAGRVGVGLDIALFALDLAYEFGLSDVFEESAGASFQGVKQNAFVLEAGLRFGL